MKICSISVGLLYFVPCVRRDKKTHSSSSWSRHNQGAVLSDHARLVLGRDATTQGASESQLTRSIRVGGYTRFTQLLRLLHCRCRTAHVGERRAGAGADAIREQVKRREQATCGGYYSAVLFCYYFARYYITNLDHWVLGWAYFRMGWAYFRERSSWKYDHPPSL